MEYSAPVSPSLPESSATVRRLLVVRHGTAEAFAPEDDQRRLTARGRREARATGEWLAEQGIVPTHALVSSATRARQTWEEVAAGSGACVAARFEDSVYAADADGALEVLQRAGGEAETLVYVGHNPTAASLPLLIDDGDPDPDAFRRMSPGFPPASVAVLEIAVPWAGLDASTGHLSAFRRGSG